MIFCELSRPIMKAARLYWYFEAAIEEVGAPILSNFAASSELGRLGLSPSCQFWQDCVEASLLAYQIDTLG